MISPRNKKIALIFDLDGTLVHSVPDMHLAISKTLKEFELGSITEEQLQLFVGQDVEVIRKGSKICGGEQV